MPQGLTINCPDTMAKPGTTVTVTGTTPNCAQTTYSASRDGGSVTIDSVACSGGNFEIKFVAPPCRQPPSTNIVTVTVQQGTDVRVCSVVLDC